MQIGAERLFEVPPVPEREDDRDAPIGLDWLDEVACPLEFHESADGALREVLLATQRHVVAGAHRLAAARRNDVVLGKDVYDAYREDEANRDARLAAVVLMPLGGLLAGAGLSGLIAVPMAEDVSGWVNAVIMAMTVVGAVMLSVGITLTMRRP